MAQTVALGGQHILRKIRYAVAGGFRPQQAAAPVGLFAGKGAGKIVGQLFVLPEHIPDFPRAAAQVARGDVGMIADVVVQFVDKRVAKAHNLAVGLAARVKIAAAFAAA